MVGRNAGYYQEGGLREAIREVSQDNFLDLLFIYIIGYQIVS